MTRAALELLPALRGLDEAGLARLALARRVPVRGIGGLLDLAEWLRSEDGVERALDELGWRRMRRLADGDPAELAHAATLLLATSPAVPGGDPARASAVPSELLPEAAERLTARLGEDGGPAARDDADPLADAHAAESAFGRVLLAGEVLRALDDAPRAAREDRRGARLAGVETRRIAADLDLDAETVGALAALLVDAGLAAPDEGSLRPTDAGRRWLAAPMPDRWRALADAWLDRLGDRERGTVMAASSGGGDPDDPAAGAPADGFLVAARALGLLVDGALSSAGALLLDDRLDDAVDRIRAAFPEPVTGVYLQPDASIIAPGPLRPDLDESLRDIARLERPGLAATYRLTRASLHRALASGLSGEEIRALLADLSIGPVPQPIAYLVDETADRYGAIRVRPHADPFARGSRILADDAALLDALEVDRSLAALGLVRTAERELGARAGAEGAYWSLAEAGHPVAAETADGRPWPLRRRRTARVRDEPVPPSVGRLVEILLADPAREEDADDSEAWLRRRLEAARRAKSAVRLVIEHAGERTTLELVPTSVSGPRLRGRDLQGDLERTIPIASIAALLDE